MRSKNRRCLLATRGRSFAIVFESGVSINSALRWESPPLAGPCFPMPSRSCGPRNTQSGTLRGARNGTDTSLLAVGDGEARRSETGSGIAADGVLVGGMHHSTCVDGTPAGPCRSPRPAGRAYGASMGIFCTLKCSTFESAKEGSKLQAIYRDARQKRHPEREEFFVETVRYLGTIRWVPSLLNNLAPADAERRKPRWSPGPSGVLFCGWEVPAWGGDA